MSALNERHQALMAKSLKYKEEFLDNYVSKMKGNVNEEVIDAFVKLADSLENNITKTAKLELMKEKNEIDRENGSGMAEVFRQIQEERMARLRRTPSDKEEEEVTYTPRGMELEEGELVTGNDGMDYETFVATRKEE